MTGRDVMIMTFSMSSPDQLALEAFKSSVTRLGSARRRDCSRWRESVIESGCVPVASVPSDQFRARWTAHDAWLIDYTCFHPLRRVADWKFSGLAGRTYSRVPFYSVLTLNWSLNLDIIAQ